MIYVYGTVKVYLIAW